MKKQKRGKRRLKRVQISMYRGIGLPVPVPDEFIYTEKITRKK